MEKPQYPHFADEANEAQRTKVPGPQVHSQEGGGGQTWNYVSSGKAETS